MSHRACALALLTGALNLGAAGAGRADLTFARDDAVETITAGFFCRARPDSATSALEGNGKVNLYLAPPPFVATGDRLTSQPGIGIAVVARLSPLLRNSVLVARESHGDPCCGKPQSWRTMARPDGTIWLGYLDSGNANFPPGLWRFSLWRGPDEVFSYDITVLPADPKAPLGCAAPTS
jgi:hypothetical protein